MAVKDYIVERTIPASAELPPGPSLPKFVQTVMITALGGRTIPRWFDRYGDVFSLRIAPAGRAVIIKKPEHIREVFAGSSSTFHAGEGNAILGPIMGRHSVLLLDEAEHLETRKRIMAAFHGETIRGYDGVIADITREVIATWPVDTPIRMHEQMNTISLEVIVRIVFGVSDGPRLDRLRPLLRELVGIGPTVFIGWLYPALDRVGPWRRFQQIKAATDRELYAEIAQRRTEPDLATRNDVLSKLLHAAPEQSDEELRDHLVTLLLAGHETTASSLAWTFHDLARRPELLARAVQAADANEHQYLEAVVKESLRLRPVIDRVARRLNAPARVAGYDLPAGVVVFPSIRGVHQRPEIYPSPQDFDPERFIGHNPPPATWIPFGGGIRRCLGAALAMTEAEAVLRTVLQERDLVPVGGPERAKIRNITTVPAQGGRMVCLPRLRSAAGPLVDAGSR